MSDDYNALPTSPDAVMHKLKTLDIPFELFEHEAVFTVAESEQVDLAIDAHHTRNMFLRTKKKENYLVTLSHDTPVDLKKLNGILGCGRFSFGSSDRLFEYLGVYPGSVTPLSVINATPGQVTIILEQAMMDAPLIAVHPLRNTMTVTMTPNDLIRFITDCGHEYRIIDLSPAAPD